MIQVMYPEPESDFQSFSNSGSGFGSGVKLNHHTSIRKAYFFYPSPTRFPIAALHMPFKCPTLKTDDGPPLLFLGTLVVVREGPHTLVAIIFMHNVCRKTLLGGR